MTQTMVEVIPRKEFTRDFGRDYQSGQHATFLGPTGKGKTTLGFDCLKTVINPQFPVVVFSGKPPSRDPVMTKAASTLNLRVVETWPPVRTYGDRKRNGYVLRPHQSMKNLDADNANIKEQYRSGLMSTYASKKPVIVFADEAYHIQYDMKLDKECNAILTRGAPDVAMWSLIQRGRFVSYHTYSAPEHLFLFYDPDATNRERYAEIGGVDPEFLIYLTEGLKTHTVKDGRTISEAVYVRRSGPQICIVDVK